MPKYNHHRTVPAYKPSTVTFLYSINMLPKVVLKVVPKVVLKVVPKVVPGSHKNKIQRCKSRYYIHQRN